MQSNSGPILLEYIVKELSYSKSITVCKHMQLLLYSWTLTDTLESMLHESRESFLTYLTNMYTKPISCRLFEVMSQETI